MKKKNEDWKNAFLLFHIFYKRILYGNDSRFEHHYSSIFQGVCLGAGFTNCDSEVHINDGRIGMVLYTN